MTGLAYQFMAFQEIILKSVLDLSNVWVDFPSCIKNFAAFDISAMGPAQSPQS